MKFLETCILALMLITQHILADGPGAADSDAADGLEQYDGNRRTDILAQEIKRARIPQFVGKRDYFANDDLDLSDDIPIEVAQAFERNVLSSLLGGSNQGLPDGSEGAAQNDYFDRQARYIPMMVGRRSKWAPKFVGKRRGPLFVGRRRSPYFVGKRTSQTDNDMAAEKRRNPMFVGKRADPVLVARGLSKPMFVGRRGHPMFVGRRTASGDLDSSIFMGKRSVENLSRRKRSVDKDEQLAIDTVTIKAINQDKARQPYNSKVIRKKRDNYSKRDRRKRDSDVIVDKDRRSFDVPYFVGKRVSNNFGTISTSAMYPLFSEIATLNTQDSELPAVVGKRGNREFDIPDFVGKRSQDPSDILGFLGKQTASRAPKLNNFTPSKNDLLSGFPDKRYSPPDFIGKRYSPPDSIGKRYSPPDFIGKRYSPPDFIGKRYSPPNFIGKRYSPPDFIGKRYSPPDFIGKRYSPPDFIGKRYSPPNFIGKRYSPPDFIGKRYSPSDFIGKRYSPPDFIGKRYSPPDFIGKRYIPPDFIGKRYIPPDFIGKRGYRYNSFETGHKRGFISPDFIGKRDPYFQFLTVRSKGDLQDDNVNNNVLDELPQRQVNAVESNDLYEPSMFFQLLTDTKVDSHKLKTSSKNPNELDNAGYPEVTEFLPALDDNHDDGSAASMTPTRIDMSGFIRKRSAEVIREDRDITFTPPDFIGKRAYRVNGNMEFVSDGRSENFNFSDLETYRKNLGKSEMYSDLPFRPGNSASKLPSGSLSKTPSLDTNFLTFFPFRRATSFISPNVIDKRSMQSGYVQTDSLDKHLASSMALHPPKMLRQTILQPKRELTSVQHSMFGNDGTKSDLDDEFSVSFISDYAGDTSIDLFGSIPERT